VQRASDRRKDDLIGKKEVLDIRRIAARRNTTRQNRPALRFRQPIAGNQLGRPATSLSGFVQYHLVHEK
jgi:hypothetical protein